MDAIRIITIHHYLSAFRYTTTKNPSDNPALKREAAIWNIATSLMKHGMPIHAAKHAPLPHREEYLAQAKRRISRLRVWSEKNPAEATALCAPYIAEYKRRASDRESRKAVVPV